MKQIEKKNPYATNSLGRIEAINKKSKEEPKVSKRTSDTDLRGAKK